MLAVPKVEPLAVNVTIWPEGMPPLLVTVAVKATVWFTAAGFRDDTRDLKLICA